VSNIARSVEAVGGIAGGREMAMLFEGESSLEDGGGSASKVDGSSFDGGGRSLESEAEVVEPGIGTNPCSISNDVGSCAGWKGTTCTFSPLNFTIVRIIRFV